MNLLFTPSDNNRISGAFLCMVTLIDILQKTYGHDVLVVLPCEGNGKELLDEYGIRNVTVLSYTWTTTIEDKDKPMAVLKDTIKAIISRKNVAQIKRLIRENDIDIVHNNTSWGYVGALAAIETETPLVWHIQEFLEEDQARTIRWQSFGYRLMARSDMALAISGSIYKKYVPIIGEDRLRLVLDGIEADKYECQDHELFVDKKVHFLMVGGGEGKGHRVAIEALMRLIAQGYDDFELVVLGRISQDYEVDLQQLFAGDASARRHFIFPGPTDDVTSYYRSSDIFLMCSRAEAFGRVTVEAMMGGCLVIGGDAAGTKELVDDGRTGYLFKSGDSDDLAEKITYALTHKEQSRVLARQGQAYMLQNMTAEVNAAHVNAVYDEVIRGGQLRASLVLVALSAPTELRWAA